MEEVQDLKIKALNGSFWSILEKFSMLIVQFVVGIILARLLSPKDYGVVALTLIFSGVAAAITDGGFEKSLIQNKTLKSVQINTIFLINILLGGLIILSIFISGPFISRFFNEPLLNPVLRVISFGILINAIGQTPSALLRKELKFKKISYSHVIGSVSGGVIGLIMAYQGMGVWALVYSTLASQLIALLGYLWFSSWRPALQFSIASIRPMLPFGINILFSSILFFSIQQFNSLIIGRYYSKTDLGLVHRGSRFPELVISIIEGVVLKMAFPVFSKVQDDNKQLSYMLMKTVKVLAFVTFPVLTILLANARDLTVVLFTEKWLGSVGYLQFFCLIKLFYPFIIIYKEVLLVKGQVKLSSLLLTCFSVAEIALVCLLVRYGITTVILSTLASAIIQYLIYTRVVSAHIQVSWFTQLGWIWKYAVISILILLTTYILDQFLNNMEGVLVLKLVIKMLAAGITYIFFALLFRVDEAGRIRGIWFSLTKQFSLVSSSLSFKR